MPLGSRSSPAPTNPAAAPLPCWDGRPQPSLEKKGALFCTKITICCFEYNFFSPSVPFELFLSEDLSSDC